MTSTHAGRLAKAYCRVIGHAGQWTYPDTRCVRVRACTRCGEVITTQQHAWSPFDYVATGRCQQERRCQRCGATEFRVVHSWGPWRYVGPDSLRLKLHQQHVCSRCGVEEQTPFERVFEGPRRVVADGQAPTPSGRSGAIMARHRRRSGRFPHRRGIVAVLVVAGLLLAACTAPSSGQPPSAATGSSGAPGAGPAALPHTRPGTQARWLIAATRRLPLPADDVRKHFDTTFLSHVSPPQINQGLQSLGRLTPTAVAVSLPTEVVFQATATGVPRPLRVFLTVNSDGLIYDVQTFPTPSSTPPTSWEGVDATLRSVAPQVRLLVADVTDGSCRQIHAIDPATAAPIASVGKLYVLAALATALQSGRVSWDQQLTLTPQLKSLPSGDLQNQPAGTRVSVRDTASYMISVSDNTAADMLIDLLGRDAVEAALPATGMTDPATDIPFLTTREGFILALDQWPALANRFIAADADGRRSLLRTVVDPAPLPDATAAQALAKPGAIDGLGPFASAEDICRVYSWLADAARQPPTTALDSVFQAEDGGLGLDPAQWQRTWFKGGFGGGVMTAAYLATTRTGRSYVVVALTENPTQAIPDTAGGSVPAAIRAAFTLAAHD